ncbi:MAG: GNAT family N-acetyltransferase [Firmicutes bacterium]|nr:GNAT family N-acetyltransferase [Bacillota bacterium]
MIEYLAPSIKDLEQMLDLLMLNYIEERTHVSILPNPSEMKPLFSRFLSRLIEKGIGLIAIENENVVGYMIGFKTGPLFGKNDGVVVPVHGHACVHYRKTEIYSGLFTQNASLWVKLGLLSHAVVMFAHDELQKNFWFENGFGKRCADAISEVKLNEPGVSQIKVMKAEFSDLPKLAELHQQHNLYYRNSPIFMPNVDEDALKDLNDWLSKENHHLWYASFQEEIVGYMRINPFGESIISYHQDVMNITGAFVKQSKRNLHIGSSLLDEIMKWLQMNNICKCGVDYESINQVGSLFWEKHFTPYTISLTRRIDERILKY